MEEGMKTASPSRRSTILVIDDDYAINDMFERMLTLEGYRVHTVRDAETALRQLGVVAPDAILVDLRMPHVDGLEFLRRLRAQPVRRDTPVAIVTGDTSIDEAMVEELTSLGATVHFKPVWCDDLLRIAQDLLAMAPQARRLPSQAHTVAPVQGES
jgi:DNA-binding NtrC family response regulator